MYSSSSSSAFTFTFTFISLFFLFLYIASSEKITSTRSVTFPEEKKTMESPGAIFELGLFRTKKEYQFQTSYHWYLGIWYKRFPERVVWVANRDQPLYSFFGILSISGSSLHLQNKVGESIWSTGLEENLKGKTGPLEAELLRNGNLVLRDQNVTVWQSFNYPTNVLIPGMKLGSEKRRLKAWKSPDDPSIGFYSYGLRSPSGVSETISESYLSGVGDWRIDPILAEVFLSSRKNRDETYNLRGKTNSTFYVLLILSDTGTLWWSQWNAPSQSWKTLLSFPNDECDVFNICGPNSYCHMSPDKKCSCIQGSQRIHSECVSNTRLSCKKARLELMKNMKVPECIDGCVVDTTIGFEECKTRCLENCNCTAVAYTVVSNGRRGCVMWNSDLIDVRHYNDNKGQDLYVKLTVSAKSDNKKGIIIGLTAAAAGVFLLCLVIFIIWKRRTRNRAIITTVIQEVSQMQPEIEIEEGWRSKLIDFDVISQATDCFSESNIIGKGGFGVVYKGLIDGQAVAVKKLFKMSEHGTQGFNNEMKIIASVQHINLVRLIGFFTSPTERILVYEFLENSSLDSYIFNPSRSSILNWKMRFDIVNGIARGLAYLHQDSRLKIIHLDLKPSNILLDKEMIPKISDFGLAKILKRDDDEANTKTAAGTFGYMSPEYAMYNTYSPKADVFSFGVMLLEIISGKKNNAYSKLNRGENLLTHIWQLWNQGNGLEIVDPVVKDSASSSSSAAAAASTFCEEEALRCIQIGLLCVQEAPNDRPMMSSVVLMLGSGNVVEVGNPKPPVETASSSSSSRQQHLQQQQESETVSLTQNEITVSFVDPQ